jgi:2'-5' RNA ligase
VNPPTAASRTLSRWPIGLGDGAAPRLGEDGRVPSEKGQSAVVVPVPAAEPLVSTWRQRFDSSAAQGMPAHITALYPFLPDERLTDGVLAMLGELCAQSPVLDVQFRHTARFPGVLYLDPEPADGLRKLTAAIAQRWPEAPPYGGAFQEVIAHLTVAHSVGDRALDHIEADVVRGLPVAARLEEAWLYVFDGRRWRPRARLSFRRRRAEG